MSLSLTSRPLKGRITASVQAATTNAASARVMPTRLVAANAGAVEARPCLEAELARQELRAREAASAGDVETSARAILAALDCERRLQGSGPQVMQVIKPRS
jgi:hypothetical protein